MRIVAYVGAAVVVGGLIVMAVAGIAGATAILVTVGALVVMVILGGQMGGRHTPNVRPVATGSRAAPPMGAAPPAGPATETPDAAGATTPTEPTRDG